MADETEIPDYFDTEIESPMAEPPADPRDEEIMALKEEVAALKDRMLRFAAEMDNTRKRLEREKAEAALYAATNFAKDLLHVADNMARALARVGELELATEVFARAIRSFFCVPGMDRDRWIDPLRGRADFETELATARERHLRTALAGFEAIEAEHRVRQIRALLSAPA